MAWNIFSKNSNNKRVGDRQVDREIDDILRQG